MSSRGIASHRRMGAQLGSSRREVDVTLVCTSCDESKDQTVPFSLDESFAKQLKAESCMWCGRLGKMKQKGVAA